MHRFLPSGPWFVVALFLVFSVLGLHPGAAPVRAYGSMALDGVRDAGYGTAIASDPSGDLATPGPKEWTGTAWTDQTALYCQNDDTYLYVYADLPQYSQSVSSGQIGLLLDRGTTAGGATDPWGNAITFGHTHKPDYVLRGNIPGISGEQDDNNGWTELRAWSDSAWSTGGTNWGGISSGGQTGGKIAYSNANGIEFKIPLADIGNPALGTMLNLSFFATQEQGSGQTKGAYDTAPSDDQSTGWDDATTLANWASCTLSASGSSGTPTNTPTATATPTVTPTPTATKTPVGTTCAGASVGDGSIVTAQIYHLNTEAAYYDPQGAVPADGSAKLRLRTCASDVQTVQVLVWLTGADLVSPSFTYNATAVSSSGDTTTWEATVPGPGSVINQWYQFRVSDGGSAGQFNPVSGNTGVGKWYTGALQNPSWALPTGPAGGGGGGATCEDAAAGDNAIAAVGLYHNNLEAAYRDPVGAIDKDGAATVILRTCKDDVSSVEVLVWVTDAGATPSNIYPAVKSASDETYDYWSYAVPGPGTVIDQWYQFRVKDSTATGHFHSAVNNTGPGAWALSASPVNPSWSLPTQGAGGGGGGGVPADFAVPAWLADAVIYQIFPDRFRNGSTANDPVDGVKVYEPNGCGDYPHAKPNPAAGGCQQDLRAWTDPLLNPSWGFDFHGGDLQGVIEKINANYFNELGVNTLYLNPIFEASSNHGYETNDYFSVRAFFGGNAAFDQLIAAANAKGLRVILDGVFNHAGMDSKYLDPYNRYASVTGACESAASPYRSWFAPGDKGVGVCSDGWGWKGWYGYATLPEFVDASDGVRDLFFRGGAAGSPDDKSVSQYWQERGIAGWRYDVAQDITHDFFADMRPYVKGSNQTGTVYGDSEQVMLGEVTGGCDWGLYQSYINGNELDSVMNYCFRDWASGYGNGDAPSQFDSKYNQFRALFPQSAWMGFMNLISTHDSPRMLNYLGGDKARLKLVTLLQFTLPGAPSVYYGDEVGMSGDKDPDNRRTFPWPDINGGRNGGSISSNGELKPGDSYDAAMLAHFKKILGLRRDHSALRRGDVTTLLVDDAAKIYSYLRWDAGEKIVVVLNNDIHGASHSATIPVGDHLPDGTVLTDLLNPGDTVTVSGGEIAVDAVAALWGRVLWVAAPPAVGIAQDETDSTAVVLAWQADGQTYNVYEHASQPYFAPAAGTLLGAGSGQFSAAGALAGPPWINRYYVIQKAGGLPSNRTGVFHIELVAGN